MTQNNLAPQDARKSAAELADRTLEFDCPALSERCVISPVREVMLEQIIRLEADTFGSDAWTAEALKNELGFEFAFYVAAVFGAQVAGYADMHIVADDAHLNSIAVIPELRKNGIGRALLAHCIAAAKQAGAEMITLEVRSNNLPALELYRSFGFELCSLRRAYYHNPPDDALNMRLALG